MKMRLQVCRNKRVGEDNWEINHICSMGKACEDRPSVYLIELNGIYICKSCLGYLTRMIDKAILEDIKNE